MRIRLYVHEWLKDEEEQPLQKERISRFQMFSAGKTQDLLPHDKRGD